MNGARAWNKAMETTRTLSPLVGQRGRLPMGDSMMVDVEVMDARVVYGQTQVSVSPVAGTGRMWVDAGRVSGLKKGGG